MKQEKKIKELVGLLSVKRRNVGSMQGEVFLMQVLGNSQKELQEMCSFLLALFKKKEDFWFNLFCVKKIIEKSDFCENLFKFCEKNIESIVFFLE